MSASPHPPHGSPPVQGGDVQLLTRLLGTQTHDAFARRAREVVNHLSIWLERAATPAPKLPPRLGPYLVGQPLGRGGMGTVFRAVHERTGKVVALKTAPANTDLARFLEAEAVALGGLDHRGVVQIFDHGEQDGFVWIALQRVRGRTLAAVIRERWGPAADDPRSPARTRTRIDAADIRTSLAWFRDLANALAAIHERGVVHRDVKPANVMIAEDGTPFLIDFGLSLDLHEHTIVDTLAGTVPYMSPEQVLSQTELDGRSDVYSLAVTMFELLTGTRIVREDERRTGLLRQIAFARVPRVSHVAPWIEPDCDGVFEKALAKDPQDRYRDARELAADLDRLLTGLEPIHARTSWTSRWRKRRKLVAAAGLVLAAAIVLAVTVGWPAWKRGADMRDLRARFARTASLGDAGSDEAVAALARALEMVPEHGADAAFQDAYGKALADFAPRITRRLFQRAALTPSNVVGNAPAGKIGSMAERHLAAAVSISENTRSELIVQAMLPELLAAHYEQVLALGRIPHDARDERIQQLTAVANLLGGHPVDQAALRLVREADYANLDPAEVCCRGILLLELSGQSATPLTGDLTRLAKALEDRLDPALAQRESRNLLAGLLALTRLRLDQPAQAEDLLNGRLMDAESGPVIEERPAMLVLAAAARFLEIVDAGQDERALALVVERFLTGAEREPGLVRAFAHEVERGRWTVPARAPAFDHACAGFFRVLAAQRPPARVFTESLLALVPYASQDWYERADYAPLLDVADLLARDGALAQLDGTTGDRLHRKFWLLAIHVASGGSVTPGAVPAERFRRCTTYRDAAARMLPTPHAEFDTALAGARLALWPDDGEARAALVASTAGLEARIDAARTAGADEPFLAVLTEEVETAVEIQNQKDPLSK